MTKAGHAYGWAPELPDHRDIPYAAHAPSEVPPTLPPAVDLRNIDFPIWNQGELGTCTANASEEAVRYAILKQGLPDFEPSRLFNYYNAGVLEGTEAQDVGRYNRDAIKVTATLGSAPESDWSYDTGPTKFAQKPPQAAYDDATKYEALTYLRINNTNLDEMKGCLAAGFPFIIGFTIYSNFETGEVAATGVAQMPAGQVLGGHAVLVVGYDDASQRFIVRNSWGTGWGMKGYFTMPYAYFVDGNLADDAWTIRLMSGPTPPPPPPPVEPVIKKVKPKHNGAVLIVSGIFSDKATAQIDGVLTASDDEENGWLHLSGLALATGEHQVVVIDNGVASEPKTFNV
jgi:C1A family cysteine protease